MSELANAFKLALGVRKYDKPPIALCPDCEAPLIGTVVLPGAEFYCLDCGHGCSFVSPIEGDPDDKELNEKLAAYEAEWDEHVETDNSGYLTDAARDWLKDRSGRLEKG